MLGAIIGHGGQVIRIWGCCAVGGGLAEWWVGGGVGCRGDVAMVLCDLYSYCVYCSVTVSDIVTIDNSQ